VRSSSPAFATPGAYFNHEWELRGRDREMAELRSALANERVTLLVAPGGDGQVAHFTGGARSFIVHRVGGMFLSAARDPSRESLEALGPEREAASG
jgi:hypothetical protein